MYQLIVYHLSFSAHQYLLSDLYSDRGIGETQRHHRPLQKSDFLFSQANYYL